MPIQKKPPIPISGVIYGEFIYWCTCISAIIVVFGTIKSFVEGSSDIPVEQLLDAVFAGQCPCQFPGYLYLGVYRS